MTALYLRVSKDDGRMGESESIQNQKAYLMEYCAKEGITDYEIYIDDGWSGLCFDRPAFREMLCNPKLNTVVTKDLSRLGRDYVKTGYYLETYFPQKGIRYIAVNDCIDTFKAQDEMLGFRAVINDMYARDISKKVRTALRTKKQAGRFVGARAPYGYKNKAGVLTVEAEKAKTVREIYRLFLFGENMCSIARILSAARVPAPNGDLWNDVTVRRILTNPTYKGDLTQNRSERLSYKLKQRRYFAEQQWITVPNTHAPIVSAKVFRAVKNKLTKTV